MKKFRYLLTVLAHREIFICDEFYSITVRFLRLTFANHFKVGIFVKIFKERVRPANRVYLSDSHGNVQVSLIETESLISNIAPKRLQ